MARAGGKWHAGKLSEIPEVQDMVARFRAHHEERSNVVMVRLSDDALARINQLVDSTLVSSRSEGAAVLIGAGRPLFPDIQQKINLKLTRTKPLASGVIILYYERAEK